MLRSALVSAFLWEESNELENLETHLISVLPGVFLFFCRERSSPDRMVFVFNRKLSSEELERKRQEMMENAKWREEERLNILKRHAKDDEREQRLEKLDSRDGKFIQ